MIIDSGYATKQGATRALKRTDLSRYPGLVLSVGSRPNPEWARIGIDKQEFIITATEETSK